MVIEAGNEVANSIINQVAIVANEHGNGNGAVVVNEMVTEKGNVVVKSIRN